MKDLFRLLTGLLCVLILCGGLVACNGQKSGEDSTLEATLATTGIPATDAGIVFYGFVAEEDFPSNDDLTLWYAQALGREQLANALICSQEETTGLWHCWLYISDHTEGEALEFFGGVDAPGSVILHLNNVGEDAVKSKALAYFTVDFAQKPTFELLVDGESQGLLITYATQSLAR